MSLLSKKDQQLTDYARIQKLRRIARRAVCKVEWLTGPELTGFYERCADGSPEQRSQLADRDAEVAKARARAKAATDEMLDIARNSNDADLRGRVKGIR